MGVDDVVAQVKKVMVSGRDLRAVFSAGESPAGQFRVKWLRRFLVTWWWLAAAVQALAFIVHFVVFVKTPSMGSPFAPAPGYAPMLNLGYAYASSLAGISLVFDLWTALGLGYLCYLWRLRGKGGTEAVKAWSIVAAVALVLGRLTGFFWSFLFALIPTFSWFVLLWPVKYGLLPPLVLLVSGVSEILVLYFFFTAAVLGFVVIPIKIFEAAIKIVNSLFVVKAAQAPFFGNLVAFWYWFTGRTLPKAEPMPDDSKGARFAAPKEILGLYNGTGDAFGHVNGRPFCLANEKHALIMASTRSGKGVSLIIPHLLRYPGSAFVLDPKGENARATGRQRAKLNNAVYYLDPFGISGKPQARFNPLARLTPENMEAESKALAAALVLGERDHWTASAQQLIAALILHVFTASGIPPQEKDLPKVRRLLLRDINTALEAMATSTAADGLLASLAISFLDTPEKEFGSIISTAQRETEILDNPFIVKCLAASGQGEQVDFADWHKGTMTVYLCLSAPKFPVFNRWLRLVLTSALDEMTDQLNPPALPVCFMLDELATLGHLAAVENAVGLAAGYGVQLFTVFQDVAQMKDLYKGRWASFIGNAGVRAVFSLDDYDTAKYWSDFLGKRLVETHSSSQNVYGLAQGQNVGEAMRPLVAPEDIMLNFAQGQMLVLPQGSHPIATKRVAYFDDPGLEGLWDDPRKPGAARTPEAKPGMSGPALPKLHRAETKQQQAPSNNPRVDSKQTAQKAKPESAAPKTIEEQLRESAALNQKRQEEEKYLISIGYKIRHMIKRGGLFSSYRTEVIKVCTPSQQNITIKEGFWEWLDQEYERHQGQK